MIAGTGALFALAAILALAAGAVVRRSAAVIATLIAAIVLPFLLAITNAPGPDRPATPGARASK